MKKYVPFVIVIITMLFITGVTMYSFVDDTKVSKAEQRKLTKMPGLSVDNWKSAEFQKQFEGFIGDHVWKRNKFISLGKKMEGYMRLPGKSLILKDVAEQDNDNNNQAEVILLDDRIVQLYKHNDENLVYFFDSCKKFYSMVPDGVDKYLVIPPGRIEYEEDSVREASNSGEYDYKLVYQNMDKSVKTVPVYDAVKKGVKKNGINEIFFRTDHHWTQLGAYYAAREFLKAAGKTSINIEDYERKQGYDFHGYLTSQYNKEEMMSPDQFYYYMPKDGSECTETVYLKNTETGKIEMKQEKVVDPYRGGYYSFLERSQFAYDVIDGQKDDGSVLLVVTDSYGYAFTTWLVSQYEKIIVVDPRCYRGVDAPFMDLFKTYKVTDMVMCLQQTEMSINLFNKQMMNNLLGIKELK